MQANLYHHPYRLYPQIHRESHRGNLLDLRLYLPHGLRLFLGA